MIISNHTDDRGDFLRVTLETGRSFVIDHDDRCFAEDYIWTIYDWNKHNSYVKTTDLGGVTLLHRLILMAPSRMFVDHRDGDGLNCRRYNMRLCTNAQNRMNVHNFKRTSSGYRGVYATAAGKFQVLISTGDKNKKRYIGTYADPIEAALVWDAHAFAIRGEFTQLNFPLD